MFDAVAQVNRECQLDEANGFDFTGKNMRDAEAEADLLALALAPVVRAPVGAGELRGLHGVPGHLPEGPLQ